MYVCTSAIRAPVFLLSSSADSPESTEQRTFTSRPTATLWPVIVRRSKQMIFSRSDKARSERASERVVFLSEEPRKPFVAPSRSLIRSLILSTFGGMGTAGTIFFLDKIIPPVGSQDTADKALSGPSQLYQDTVCNRRTKPAPNCFSVSRPTHHFRIRSQAGKDGAKDHQAAERQGLDREPHRAGPRLDGSCKKKMNYLVPQKGLS